MCGSHVFLFEAESRRMRTRIIIGPVALLLAIAAVGCYAGYFAYHSQSGGSEGAVGEDRVVNLPVNEAYLLSQDVLRGEGILFERKPDNKIETLWKSADVPAGFLPSIVGVTPRYRYELQVVPEGTSKSRVVINVRGEDMTDEQIASYKADERFAFFKKLDTLMAQAPPGTTGPTSGGVNFTLLPKEDLRGLAKRVTGSEDNWSKIAKDNGIASAAQVSAFQTIWVRNDLLKDKPKTP